MPICSGGSRQHFIKTGQPSLAGLCRCSPRTPVAAYIGTGMAIRDADFRDKKRRPLECRLHVLLVIKTGRRRQNWSKAPQN